MQEHPYKKFENSQLWKIVESSIIDLVNNHDLDEKTMREHIVGYIVKCIEENKNKTNTKGKPHFHPGTEEEWNGEHHT